jgi:hypothetical protein
MSLTDRPFIDGKRCFGYCGDEICDCDLSPYYHENPAPDASPPHGPTGVYHILDSNECAGVNEHDSMHDELQRFREALERIADEQKVYKGHGDYDIIPALNREEAQAVARKALMGKS